MRQIIHFISILQHVSSVSSKERTSFFFLPIHRFFFLFFSLVFLVRRLAGFSDYLLVHTLIYAARFCLELGVSSSADRRRHLPSVPDCIFL
ncbi:unnamed protein product [Brassica rapa subsp. narinosa]